MNDRLRRVNPIELAELNERILSEHRDEPHPQVATGALKAHLLIHAMVEKQLLEDDPPAVGLTLERLLDSGMSRHEAVHAIGEVITREAVGMLKADRELDLASYLAGLARLGQPAAEPKL